jgi:flagellar protein FliJ
MNHLQPLTILLEHCDRGRDAAAADHRRLQAASDAAAAQREQLQAYRQEYEQRWAGQFRLGASIDLLRNYQSFTQRLAQAIEQQGRIADHAAQQAERARTALLEAEMRSASARKLIERRLREQRLGTERREQKQTDEAASRLAWTRVDATRPAPLM